MRKTNTLAKNFTETVYELAFGDNAINRGFSESEVLQMIKQMSDAYSEKQEPEFKQEDVAADDCLPICLSHGIYTYI